MVNSRCDVWAATGIIFALISLAAPTLSEAASPAITRPPALVAASGTVSALDFSATPGTGGDSDASSGALPLSAFADDGDEKGSSIANASNEAGPSVTATSGVLCTSEATLVYQARVIAPRNQLVPLSVIGLMHTQVGAGTSSLARAAAYVMDLNTGIYLYSNPISNGAYAGGGVETTVDVDQTVSVIPGHVIQVSMSAFGQGGGTDASAYVNGFELSIDPDFAAAHPRVVLQLSPGLIP